MTCGYCDYAELDKKSTYIICKKSNQKVTLNTKKCDDYLLREDLLKENSVCGVCEYMLMDEYCGYLSKYTSHDSKPCEFFVPCEEFIKGEIGW